MKLLKTLISAALILCVLLSPAPAALAKDGDPRFDGKTWEEVVEDFNARSPAGEENSGTVLSLRYCAVQDGADCPDNTLQIAVALDDGSIYRFNAENYSSEKADVSWNVDQEGAAEALPATLTVRETRRLICKSEGKRDLACYAFFCEDEDGRGVTVYVDAATGKQFRIEL